jgi:CO dehydrogenase maturation factor
VCPENAFLKQLISHLVLVRDEVVLLDMEAGIEHLGRGTATGVDVMIVVVEPNRTSLETAERIKKLATELGIRQLQAVANKVMDNNDRSFIKANLTLDLLGQIDFSTELRQASARETTVFSITGAPLEQIRAIAAAIQQTIEKTQSRISTQAFDNRR